MSEVRHYAVQRSEGAWQVHADGAFISMSATRERALWMAEAMARKASPSVVAVVDEAGRPQVTAEYN